jgi:uncharacterized protein YbaR (Trm112 family)
VVATCTYCGRDFESAERKNPAKVCSPACRTRLYYASQTEEERAERLRKNREYQRRKREQIRKTSPVCPSCGKPKPAKGGTYCTRTTKCRSLARQENPPCKVDGCTKPRQGRGMCYSHYSAWYRSQNKHTITCTWCGKTAKVDRRTRTTCSPQCAAFVGARASYEELRRQTPRPLVPYTGPKHPPRPKAWIRATRRLTSGQCRVCATWFVSLQMDITCSPKCCDTYHVEQKRVLRARRRARRKNAFVANVSPKEVFERDGYRCHICHKKTDPTKGVPHPKAPTVDHLIPLAQGGTHEPANCRTACFLCNARKGDRGGGEQLLLIA